MRITRQFERPSSRPIWGGDRPVADATRGLKETLRLLRRNLPFLAVWVSVWLAGGLLYVKRLAPEFVASTQVLLQPRLIVNDGPEDVRHFHQFTVDGDQCETELRVLRSEQLLYRVFKMLDLADSPESRSGPNGLWAFLAAQAHRLERNSQPSDADIEAFYAFADRVRARRLGLSYVIEISYRAQSAAQAARVANAIAVAYAAHRLRGVLAREQRRGVYLESRLKGLYSQILAADAGVRFGTIPDARMPDADVRLLGPANVPLRSSYPKSGPFLLMMAGLGTLSGLLIILLPGPAPVRPAARRGPLPNFLQRMRLA
ncbi:hypothetical protein [Methylobacterium organophilum]|uniref:Lipopolysaccharide biosynthesis protein n=1 Tax=Methylobacterium organophilum TaxID=410 RepID=A0ABQ4TCQ9_METOR|nr:hypothetical protein [Methylobacterium organophilum]GJE28444.1 hypothetical protein LKMONMHP_3315 [Methylobacterium organophilum]